MASIDISEALAGIRLAAKSTPPGTPAEPQDVGDFSDPELVKRISAVEEQLLQLYNNQVKISSSSQDDEDLSAEFKANKEDIVPISDLPIHKRHAYPCPITHKILPAQPTSWPQAPVMMRPTPNTNMTIRGIRFASTQDYADFSGFCSGCILPINDGREPAGKSLCIDFESKHFVGTLMMRIKDVKKATASLKGAKASNYFAGKKRRFQAIVKGRFKTKGIRMRDCVTGQTFDRPAGKLPAKWIVSSFIKFVSTLAPQLEATVDGRQPRFLTPLCATAHTVLAKPAMADDQTYYCVPAESTPQQKERLLNYLIYKGSQDIEQDIEEPAGTDPTSILQEFDAQPPNNTESSVGSRQKARKKVLNALAASPTTMDGPTFDVNKEYTFEFYQHLLLFGDKFAVDLGTPIGKVGLSSALDGQPLKFMAAVRDSNNESDTKLDYLWCFDLWHKSLFAYAKKAAATVK